MTPTQQADWRGLEASYPPKVVRKLRQLFRQSGPFVLTARDLVTEFPALGEETALSLLRTLAHIGLLSEEPRSACPKCGAVLAPEEIDAKLCSKCQANLAEEGSLQDVLVFIRRAPPSRDVRWVLTLHGMDTRGAWQEDFNWLLSRTYSHAVPVAIYKYGIVRPGAFLRFRQRKLVRHLTSRIRRLIGQTEDAGFGDCPDVIAHSLGTLLLGKALQENPSLRVGRIILVGSILRPDFDWQTLIGRGQIEAVLNHFGTKDFWALVAHYFMPDAGPSGRIGFNDKVPVINVCGKGFRHSDFFLAEKMQGHFEEVWGPFLTLSREEVASLDDFGKERELWRETWWPFRATLPRFLLLGFGMAIALLLAASTAIGLWTITRWLLGD
jgi:hypothetical protein